MSSVSPLMRMLLCLVTLPALFLHPGDKRAAARSADDSTVVAVVLSPMSPAKHAFLLVDLGQDICWRPVTFEGKPTIPKGSRCGWSFMWHAGAVGTRTSSKGWAWLMYEPSATRPFDECVLQYLDEMPAFLDAAGCTSAGREKLGAQTYARVSGQRVTLRRFEQVVKTPDGFERPILTAYLDVHGTIVTLTVLDFFGRENAFKRCLKRLRLVPEVTRPKTAFRPFRLLVSYRPQGPGWDSYWVTAQIPWWLQPEPLHGSWLSGPFPEVFRLKFSDELEIRIAHKAMRSLKPMRDVGEAYVSRLGDLGLKVSDPESTEVDGLPAILVHHGADGSDSSSMVDVLWQWVPPPPATCNPLFHGFRVKSLHASAEKKKRDAKVLEVLRASLRIVSHP